MSPQALANALHEARVLGPSRSWTPPTPATQTEAAHLLALLLATEPAWPPAEIEVQPDGAIHFDWDAGERGWVTLCVNGSGLLTHSAVIDGDEYTLAEPWNPTSGALTDWAGEVLRRLWNAWRKIDR
jgi:hypothetical protein